MALEKVNSPDDIKKLSKEEINKVINATLNEAEGLIKSQKK